MCPANFRADEDEISAAVLDHLERLVQERDAGRVLCRDELTAFEWEAILIWDANEASYEKAHRARLKAMFEMLANSYK